MSNEWLSEQLSNLLQFPVPQDMIDYIDSITNVRDLEDYMRTLLDKNNSQHNTFLFELLQRRRGGGIGYKKSEVDEVYIAPKVEKKKKDKGNKSQSASSSFLKQETPEQKSQQKKKKYVNLYSQEGQDRDVVLLKGRNKCDCQASKHKLINNCLKCGRIVCAQEGSGPCFFCGNLVCSREEQEFLSSGTKQSNHFMQKLMDQKPPGYEAAIEQRNRLLEYDRTSEKRTRIIDDESDYFSSNSVWIAPAERERLRQKEEELQAKKHQSRRDRVLTLDVGLKRMIESTPNELNMDELDEVLQDISNSVNSGRAYSWEDTDTADSGIDLKLKYDESVIYELEGSRRALHYLPESPQTKIQDKEYLEMVDEGLCLSLHQPWASLLVAGIKMHEGRNWYTPHRGRLWIASAAKVPTEDEIKDTESLYTSLRGINVFPLTYPTGCLLGCVNIANCMPQEEYRKTFPDGESDSPFVFICEAPQELPIRFPIMGKHKIYKLDPMIHQAAEKAMQRIAKIKAEKNSQSFLRNS